MNISEYPFSTFIGRVIETGPARGISAACLASAVGDRPGAIVVTLDISAWPEREALWCELPESMRHCIQPRPPERERSS